MSGASSPVKYSQLQDALRKAADRLETPMEKIHVFNIVSHKNNTKAITQALYHAKTEGSLPAPLMVCSRPHGSSPFVVSPASSFHTPDSGQKTLEAITEMVKGVAPRSSVMLAPAVRFFCVTHDVMLDRRVGPEQVDAVKKVVSASLAGLSSGPANAAFFVDLSRTNACPWGQVFIRFTDREAYRLFLDSLQSLSSGSNGEPGSNGSNYRFYLDGKKRIARLVSPAGQRQATASTTPPAAPSARPPVVQTTTTTTTLPPEATPRTAPLARPLVTAPQESKLGDPTLKKIDKVLTDLNAKMIARMAEWNARMDARMDEWNAQMKASFEEWARQNLPTSYYH